MHSNPTRKCQVYNTIQAGNRREQVQGCCRLQIQYGLDHPPMFKSTNPRSGFRVREQNHDDCG
jgi:hypothetical protein